MKYGIFEANAEVRESEYHGEWDFVEAADAAKLVELFDDLDEAKKRLATKQAYCSSQRSNGGYRFYDAQVAFVAEALTDEYDPHDRDYYPGDGYAITPIDIKSVPRW